MVLAVAACTTAPASSLIAPAQKPAAAAQAVSLKEKAHFWLDEGVGSRSALGDASGKLSATLSGGAQLGASGKNGSALTLNGTTGYAATARSVVDTTTSFSVSAWVRLDRKNRNYTVLSQAGSVNSGFQLYYSKYWDKWIFNRHATDKKPTEIVRAMAKNPAKHGVWTHLTGMYDAPAKQIKLYVNGELQSTARFTTPWRAGGALQIGRLRYLGGWAENFAGTIDEVRISEQGAPGDCSGTDVVGHRGAPQIAPENTLASLEAAADRGVDWVETDVRNTKDGVPVIMHDPTVDRTTDGTGKVDQLTAAQMAALTVDGGGRVPTLQEVLALLKGKSVRFLPDLKGPQTQESVDRTLKLIADAGMSGRTAVSSFDEKVIRYAAASPHRIRLVLLRSTLDADPTATARKYSLSAYSVDHRALSKRPKVVEQLEAAGVDVVVWTPNSEGEWKNATSWGVDGIITDRSDQLLAWRTSHCKGT